MATTLVAVDVPTGLTHFKETDLNATKAAVKASSGTLYGVIIDNTANSASAEFVKLWDVASGGVTVGTTAPDWCFKIPAAVKHAILFTEGVAFGTALTAACVTTAGIAGTTNPTADVAVTIIFA